MDHKFLKKGDKVWMPVEVPGATYQTAETAGIASVFDPLGIKYELLDAGTDPARMIANMTDYLAAHGKEIAAMIGQVRMKATAFMPPSIQRGSSSV